MPKHTVRMNASGTKAKAKAKYVVEIDHGEETGAIKRIKFRDEDAAIKFAALLRKGKSTAIVLSPDGQEIYPPVDSHEQRACWGSRTRWQAPTINQLEEEYDATNRADPNEPTCSRVLPCCSRGPHH